MRTRQTEPIENVLTRYFQYPALVARRERDLAMIAEQISELDELIRAGVLMPSQGVAHPEAIPNAGGVHSDPVSVLTQQYQQHMKQAMQELFALRNSQLAIRRELSGLEREYVLLTTGMDQLTPWVREFLEMRYRYPMHDYKQIGLSCDPEIDESTVRFHIHRALAGLRSYLASFAPITLLNAVSFSSRYAPADSLYF